MPRYYKADFERAIPGSGGIISTIADRVGCSWHTAKAHIDRSSDLTEMWQNERYKRNDVAVSIYQINIDSLYQYQAYCRRQAQYWREQGNEEKYLEWLHRSVVELGDVRWWLNKMDADFKDQLDLNMNTDQPLIGIRIDYRDYLTPLAPRPVPDSVSSSEIQSAGNGAAVGQNGSGG
jgi:hypothetical protein